MSKRERKEAAKEVRTILFEVIRKHPEGVRQSLLVGSTGLSIDQVHDFLDEILDEYPCKLTVDEQGVITYHFQINTSEDKFTFYDGLNWLLEHVFDLLIVFMFTFYFWLYIPYSIVLLIRNPWSLIWTFIASPFIAMLAGLIFYSMSMDQGMKNLQRRAAHFLFGRKIYFHGYSKREYSFFRSIRYFAFGYRTKQNYLMRDKNVLNYINSKDKVITISEIAALTGFTYDEASEYSTKLMTKYHGKVEVTKEGILLFRFPEVDSFNETSKDYIYAWEDDLRSIGHNKNYIFENILVFMSISYVTLASGVLLSLNGPTYLPDIPIISFLLNQHIIPLGFCLIYIVTSFANRVVRKKQKRELIKRMKYLQALSIIYQKRETIFQDELGEYFDELYLNYMGEPDTDENGNIVGNFSLIQEELEIVENLRIIKDKKTEPNESKRISNINRITDYCFYILEGDDLKIYIRKKFTLALLGNAIIFFVLFGLGIYVLIKMFINSSFDEIIMLMFFTWPIWSLGSWLVLSQIYSSLVPIFNTIYIHLTPESFSIRQGPIRLFQLNGEFTYDRLESVFVKPDVPIGNRLGISLKRKKFATFLLRYETNKKYLKEINALIYDYLEE